MDRDFKPSAQTYLIMLRALAGLVVIYIAYNQKVSLTGIGLVLCIWLDVAIGMIAKRQQWQKNAGDIQLESFADFICFVIAPAFFVLCLATTAGVWLGLVVFILSGIWRIARFNIEGLKSGYYEGLPVTYNGYLFPALALIIHYLNVPASLALPPFLRVLSLLMVTRKIKVPEV